MAFLLRDNLSWLDRGKLVVALGAVAVLVGVDARPESAAADAPGDLALVGQIGGPTRAVALAGDFVYAGRGPRVMAMSICHPFAASHLGQSEVLPGPVMDLLPDGDLLYAALGHEGVGVLDVTRPGQPRLVFRLPLPGTAAHLVREGDRLYVVSGYSGLHILSLQDRRSPQAIGHFDAVVSDVVVFGTYAYAVKRDFTVIDVSDPAAPRQVRKLADWADSVALRGTTMVVAVSSSTSGGGREGALQVFDLAEPAHPRSRGRLPIGPPARLMRFVGDRLIAIQPGYLREVDLSDPDQPAAVEQPRSEPNAVSAVAGDERVLVLALGPDGLFVRSASGGYFEDRALADAQAVAVAEGIAYVEDEGGLNQVRLYDVRRPEGPRALLGFPRGVAHECMAAAGGRLVLAGTDQTLLAYDVLGSLEGWKPRIESLGSLRLDEPIWSIDVEGDRIVVAADRTLRVVDLVANGGLVEKGSAPASGGATDVALAGDVAYVTGPATGLESARPSLMGFEISSTGRPRERSVMTDAAGWHHGLTAGLGAVFLDGLQVVQGDGARSLHQVARLTIEGETRALALSGHRLYAAMRLPDGRGRLVRYDVSQPAAPRLDASLELLDEALDVDVWQGYVFVAAKEAGLLVVRTSDSQPPPTPSRPPIRENLAYMPLAGRGLVAVSCPMGGR